MTSGRVTRLGLFGLLILVSGILTFYKAYDLIAGINLEVESPRNGETVRDPFVVVRGRAAGSSLLTVSGATVLADRNGFFQRELLLGVGYNVIEIKALDRFNRESKKLLELVYKPLESKSSSTVAVIR